MSRSRRFTRRSLVKAGGVGAAGAAAFGVSGCLGGDDPTPAAADAALAVDGDAPNVLLIVTDSTRTDFVGAYGGDERAKTPNLDALAGEGVRFTQARPEAMPTVPVRRALLTGQRAFPFRNWKVEQGLPPFPGWISIPDNMPTFPEVMKAAGVATAYVTDNPFLVGPRFADFRGSLDHSRSDFSQGEYREYNRPVPKRERASVEEVEDYLLPSQRGSVSERRLREYFGINETLKDPEDYSAERVMGAGRRLLSRLKDQGPFFLGVDAFDPHEAFNPPHAFLRRFGGPREDGVEPIAPFDVPFSNVEEIEITDEQLERVRELYAAELTYVDDSIGRLLNELDDLGLADDTVVVYLSDHGVSLGEHGILGKYSGMLHREVYDIPYIVRDPQRRRAGETSDWFASTHDVAPTLLTYQGITVPGKMDGETLTTVFDGGEPPERACWTTCEAGFVAAGDGRYMLNADNQGEAKRLYDTREDPEETQDIASDHPEIVARLWQHLLDDAGGTLPVFGPDGVVSG